MHRITRIIAGAATIWLGFSLCGTACDALAATAPPTQSNPPPSIDRIRELAELTVLEVDASEIVRTHISGHTGGTSVVVLVHGTLTYAVSLDEARYLQVDQEQRRLVMALPQPKVRRVAIDPQRSRMLSCKRSGLWQVAVGPAHEDEAIALALAIGQNRLRDATSRDDLVERARFHAESVLGQFVSEMGWSLNVRWDE